MSYTVYSATLSALVTTSDHPGADADALAQPYREQSAPDVSIGIRLFCCHGLAIAIIATVIISETHQHRKYRDMGIAKAYRLGNRIAVCIVMFLLPLAHQLDSLYLLSIMSSLVVWILSVDIWSWSYIGDPCPGLEKYPRYEYTARYTRKTLDAALRADGEIDVVELSRRERAAT